MRWLFWKKAPPPPRPVLRDIERPRGSLGGPWMPEAPEDWPDMAEFDRENQECHERANLSGGGKPYGLLGGVNVFPRIGARKRDLVALGEAMEAWRVRHSGEVVGISGLENLQQGRYPEMETWMGCMNDRTMYAPGWEICPVRVSTQGALFELEPLVACLEDELPQELYSYVGTLMPD